MTRTAPPDDPAARQVYLHERHAGQPDAARDRCAQTLAVISSLVRIGDSLLDVRAGTGRLALPLARCVGHVTALDRTPAMLEILRPRLALADRYPGQPARCPGKPSILLRDAARGGRAARPGRGPTGGHPAVCARDGPIAGASPGRLALPPSLPGRGHDLAPRDVSVPVGGLTAGDAWDIMHLIHTRRHTRCNDSISPWTTKRSSC
jgi:SAM-dependent methyltransferase